MTSITIVTPWLQARELQPDYLRAANVRGPDDHVIVVDNGDAPAFPDDITVITPGRNVGFSRACNLGLREAETSAVLFLNNDIRMTAPDWLERIREALAPNVLVGAELRADPHTIVDGATHPYLDGWCIAGLTTDWLMLGGWDETLEEPSYWGDNILSAAARARGYELRPAAVGLTHLSNYTSRRMAIADVSNRNRARYEAAVRSLDP